MSEPPTPHPEAALPWEAPLGAFPAPDGRVTFRVWAPRAESVAVAIGGARHALAPVGFGVHAGSAPGAAGDDYAFVLDGGDPLPDPCSRWQPAGLRGASRVLDPAGFTWSDAGFRTPALRDVVLY